MESLSESKGEDSSLSLSNAIQIFQLGLMVAITTYGVFVWAQKHLNAVIRPALERQDFRPPVADRRIHQIGLDFRNLPIEFETQQQVTKKQEKKEKQEMFGSSAVNLVEMSYWFVKFVEFYNKMYQAGGAGASPPSKMESFTGLQEFLFGSTASRIVKFSRFLVKYFTTFDKLFESARNLWK